MLAADQRTELFVARRLGRAETTIKAYLYDPTGDKARAVKARYRGMCRCCGSPTAPRNGKGDAYAYCKRCHPGAVARRSSDFRPENGPASSTVTDLYGAWAAAIADAFGGA